MRSIYSKTRVKVKLISRKPWEGVLGGRNALRVKGVPTLPLLQGGEDKALPIKRERIM